MNIPPDQKIVCELTTQDAHFKITEVKIIPASSFTIWVGSTPFDFVGDLDMMFESPRSLLEKFIVQAQFWPPPQSKN